mgnify:CR=1 FL=1
MAKQGYHHGNLREALIVACLRLVEEKGPTGFTLSEAARVAGDAGTVVADVVRRTRTGQILEVVAGDRRLTSGHANQRSCDHRTHRSRVQHAGARSQASEALRASPRCPTSNRANGARCCSREDRNADPRRAREGQRTRR